MQSPFLFLLGKDIGIPHIREDAVAFSRVSEVSLSEVGLVLHQKQREGLRKGM